MKDFFKRRQSWFYLIIIATMIALRWLPSCLFEFLSDDYGILYQGSRPFLEQLRPNPYGYHFVPLGQWLFAFPRHLFGLDAVGFHLLNIFFHFVNACLLYFLAQSLSMSKPEAFLASLLFSLFYISYEAIFWLTGAFYLWITMLVLLSLLIFIRYKEEKMPYAPLLLLPLFILSLLILEASASLPFIFLAYDVTHGKWKKRDLWRLYLPMALVLLVDIALKDLLTASLWPRVNSLPAALKNLLVSQTLLLLPNDGSLVRSLVKGKGGLPLLGLLGAWLAAFYRVVLTKGPPLAKFSLLWGLAALLPSCLLSGVEARYFYPASLAGSLLLSFALFRFREKALSLLQRPLRRWASPLVKLLFLSLCLLIMAEDWLFISERRWEWKGASAIASNILVSTLNHLEELDGKALYFVNIPDSISSYRAWPAYIFRNGLYEALWFATSGSVGTVHMVKTPNAYWAVEKALVVDSKRLKELARDENSLLFIYLPEEKRVVRAFFGQ